nr:hypothetical protein [Acidobacteriota bacterium]
MKPKLSFESMKYGIELKILFPVFLIIGLFLNSDTFAQTQKETRTLSGTVLTQQFELVPNVSIEVETSGGKLNAVSDAEGAFSLEVPKESLSVKFFGSNIQPVTRIFAQTDRIENLQIKTNYTVSPINENVTIEAETLSPEVEERNDSVYKNTLFG